MPDVRVPESTADRHVGQTYVDAPVNYLADLSVKPVTYNPPPGTGVPQRNGNYQFFEVRVHNARPYADALIKRETGASKVVVFDHTVRTGARAVERGLRTPVQSVHNDYTERSGPQRVRDLLPPEEAEVRLKKRYAEY